MQIKIKKIKNFLVNLILFIIKHDFLVCLFLFLLSLLFGVFLIYKYSILAQKVEVGEVGQSFLIKEQSYQEILKIWQEQEEIFKQADSKEYSNPFKPISAPEGELTE